ncbi:MAG: diguanylate cyclase [Pseudorhodoplanes sp.]|nr:diguanylate cyclase [Pseudorhodoplanes sp.]
MLLDVTTLFAVSICITALLGLFLLMLWAQDRSVDALGWWGAAYLLGGFAVALWMLGPSVLPAGVDQAAPALLFICCGMIWTGARKFYGRSALRLAAMTGALVWLMVVHLPAIAEWSMARVFLASVIISVYAFLTASELRRERRNSAQAGVRVVAVPLLHSTVFFTPILGMHFISDTGPDFGASSFALFVLLTLLYIVGSAFILVIMAKERSELLHKTAAVTDPLTGIYNRRGLLEAAQRLFAAQARKRQRITVLMFDLDHFKSINDRFGHEMGDEALRVFAQTAAGTMRSSDVLGRFGGEEFVAILPGGLDGAAVVAERVRAAFEIAGVTIGGHRMNATVSIGAASADAARADLQTLMTHADGALYRAKAKGRNRVEEAGEIEAAPISDVASEAAQAGTVAAGAKISSAPVLVTS